MGYRDDLVGKGLAAKHEDLSLISSAEAQSCVHMYAIPDLGRWTQGPWGLLPTYPAELVSTNLVEILSQKI